MAISANLNPLEDIISKKARKEYTIDGSHAASRATDVSHAAIMNASSETVHCRNWQSRTYMWFPTTLPFCTLFTFSGRGASHRSGFHSAASSPQTAVRRLQPWMPTMTVWPFFRAIWCTAWSFVPVSGCERGKTVSARVLEIILNQSPQFEDSERTVTFD